MCANLLVNSCPDTERQREALEDRRMSFAKGLTNGSPFQLPEDETKS